MRPWLDWALERCAQATGCQLSESSLLRLASLDRDLPPARRALALAAAGSLRSAEAIEREHRKEKGALGPDWAPYAAGMTGPLVRRGEAEDALALLRDIPATGRDFIGYWLAYGSAAEAAGSDSDRALAEAWLESEARNRWQSRDWMVSGRQSKLAMWPEEPAAGLALRLQVAGEDRGILEIVWDGSVAQTVPAVNGRVLELRVSVSKDIHSLEIRAREGAATTTAAVRLLPLAQ